MLFSPVQTASISLAILVCKVPRTPVRRSGRPIPGGVCPSYPQGARSCTSSCWTNKAQAGPPSTPVYSKLCTRELCSELPQSPALVGTSLIRPVGAVDISVPA